MPGIPRSTKSPWGEFVGTWDMKKPPLRTKTIKTNAMSTSLQKNTEPPARTPSPKEEVTADKARTPTPQQEEVQTPSPQEGKASPRPPSQSSQCKKSPSPVVAKPLNQLLHLLLRALPKKIIHPRIQLCFLTQLNVCLAPCTLQVIHSLSNCKK